MARVSSSVARAYPRAFHRSSPVGQQGWRGGRQVRTNSAGTTPVRHSHNPTCEPELAYGPPTRDHEPQRGAAGAASHRRGPGRRHGTVAFWWASRLEADHHVLLRAFQQPLLLCLESRSS